MPNFYQKFLNFWFASAPGFRLKQKRLVTKNFLALNRLMSAKRHIDYSQKWNGLRDAATALFAADGYQRTSMRALADRLGVTTSYIDTYFRDKEALLYAVLDTHLLDLLAEVERAEPIGAPPEERLTALAGAYLAWLAGAGAAGQRVLLEATRFLSPAHRADIDTRQRWLAALFADALAGGLPPAAQPRLLAPLTHGLLRLLESFAAEETIETGEAAALAVRCILHGTTTKADAKA
jgi:AcrR family transcriptional regulator